MTKKIEELILEQLFNLTSKVDKMQEEMVTKKDLNEILKGFSTKDDLKNFATKDDLKNFATKDDLKNFATKDDLKNFATKDDLKNFATKDDLKNFATKDDLKNFATKDDLKNFATKDDFKNFATKEDLNDLEGRIYKNIDKKIDDKLKQQTIEIAEIFHDTFHMIENAKNEAKEYTDMKTEKLRKEFAIKKQY